MAGIIIVGNGPMHQLGEKIDVFSTVIRMNRGIMYLKRRHTGIKTDLWSVRGRGITEDSRKYFSLIKRWMEYRPDDIWNFNQSSGNIPKEWQRAAREIIGSLPTLGIMTIMKALEEYESFYPLTITGFTFLAPGQHHFWGGTLTKHTPQHQHNMEKEKRMVEDFIKDGVLQWLV